MAASTDRAREDGVTGTPTVLVGRTRLTDLSVAGLTAAVQAARAGWGRLVDMSANTLPRVRTRLSSAVPVVVGLAAGFGVAQGTGVRALGGAVFVAGGLVAGWLWYRRRGTAVALALAAAYVVAFVLAHVLALGVGLNAWLAVALVTAATAALAALVGDRSQAGAAAR